MLSRTAENLFWMGRYMERAEMTARLLDVGSRITLLPSSAGQGFRDDWDSLLQASGTAAKGLHAKYGEADQQNIESYLFFDRDNAVFGRILSGTGARKRADRADGADKPGLGRA